MYLNSLSIEMGNDHRYDISVILPSMNEGDNVKKVIEEIYTQFTRLKLNGEIIAIDAPSKSPSMPTYDSYANNKDNFTAVELSEKKKAGSGKTLQYMIGFKLAQGKYIIQMDSDGQDDPADLHKFIEQLDAGFDLVVGHKQDRKDGAVYMLTSKVGNTLTRVLTGTTVHDMNCGFKGYPAKVAKSLNLRGRWYRYIPSILASKGYKVTEVPINNRKREWGNTNFSFFNRLQGGLFDMLVIAIINRYRDTPMYFWGWLGIAMVAISFPFAALGVLLNEGTYKIVSFMFSFLLLQSAFISFIVGLSNEFSRDQERIPLKEMPIKRIVKK